MNEITQSSVFKAATEVASSVTQPLQLAAPSTQQCLSSLQQLCTHNGLLNLYSLGKLYGSVVSIESFLNALFEGLKIKEDDPVAREKISSMHKTMLSLWNFFTSSYGKQLTETDLLAILAGYITPGYEKINQKN